MRFWKGHALGNDYIIVEGEPPPAAVIRALCDRHRGLGGDGVLVSGTGPGSGPTLRIMNPDGSEAEKSGNGLRIYGAWLHGEGRVGGAPFEVRLSAETVEMRVESEEPGGVRVLRVAMGRASFRAADVGWTGQAADAEVMGGEAEVAGERLALHLVSMGNPHCVVFEDPLDPGRFRRLAPALQADPAFGRGVNVQFARVVGPGELEALVWERGAGETLASGSSACAVAAAALRSGRAGGVAAGEATSHDRSFLVRMPGGELGVDVGDDWRITLTGPAQIVATGRVADAAVAGWSATSGRVP